MEVPKNISNKQTKYVEREIDVNYSKASSVISRLQEISETENVSLDDITLEISYNLGYYDSVDFTVSASFTREETDEENQTRIDRWLLDQEKTKNEKENKKKIEYETYLKLKEKFEKETN